MVQDRGQTMIVTSGGSAFEIGVDRLTNDIDLGELAARRDAESQQALATTLQGERQAMLTAQGKSQAWFDEQQRAVTTRRVAAAAALQQHRSPLDRGAYAEKENVSWRPYIYDQPYYYTYYPYRSPWTRP
jgi:hypothetical protein